MKTELKTLKDLCQEHGSHSEEYCPYCYDLKAEAIKWVKKHLVYNADLEEWTLLEHMGTNEWLKFFNITEEDLK